MSVRGIERRKQGGWESGRYDSEVEWMVRERKVAGEEGKEKERV